MGTGTGTDAGTGGPALLALQRLETLARRRRQRRSLAWVAVGLLGLAMGAVWATGFATSEAEVGTTASASPILGTAHDAPPVSQYADTVTTSGLDTLTIGFTGIWGSIEADESLFKIDLSGFPAAQQFFATVYLTNSPTGWSTLQLELARVEGSCDATTDFSAAAGSDTSVMVVESVDAYASFSGLAGGQVYCIGIADATPRAEDPNGTFVQRPNVASSPTLPNLAAVVNRTA